MLKMKKIGPILMVVSAILLSGCAAPGANTPVLEVQDVHEVPGYSKEELYDQSKLWVAETFVDAKQVIEMADPDKGLLMANGSFDLVFLGIQKPTRFSLRLDVKDEKIRTTYKNFQMLTSQNDWYTIREGTSNGYPDQARNKAEELNQSLLQFIRSDQSNDDW